MKKVVCFLFLALLLLTVGAANAWAEEALPPKLQKLSDEAYHYYSSRETDKYFTTVKAVKDATEFCLPPCLWPRSRACSARWLTDD